MWIWISTPPVCHQRSSRNRIGLLHKKVWKTCEIATRISILDFLTLKSKMMIRMIESGKSDQNKAKNFIWRWHVASSPPSENHVSAELKMMWCALLFSTANQVSCISEEQDEKKYILRSWPLTAKLVKLYARLHSTINRQRRKSWSKWWHPLR